MSNGKGSSSSSNWPSSSSDDDEHVSSSLLSKSATIGCRTARGVLFGPSDSLMTRWISVAKQASVEEDGSPFCRVHWLAK
ncbi:hypothetical protein NL676_012664 [Syzygium grande]|nr:hypothetical protein NL676_012664 [Syzygium grande]